MPSLVDVWRAVDATGTLVAGNHDRLRSPVRGVVRTRATSPILPPIGPGELLVADAASLGEMTVRQLFEGIRASGAEPVGVLFAAGLPPDIGDVAAGPIPLIVSAVGAATVVARTRDYLDGESTLLERWQLELRVAMAEAALADPGPAAPAGVAGARLGRGIAIARAGRLVSVHPAAGRESIALEFTATFARLFTGPSDRRTLERRTRNGLWVAEYPVRDATRVSARRGDARGDASRRETVWLFDDVPFGAIDRLAGAAVAQTLSAIARGAAGSAAVPRAAERDPAPRRGGSARRAAPTPSGPPSAEAETLARTLMAVARSNGRVAPAARALGVHRNTVLYRLRRARSELGIDPRRPDDALRLLRDGVPAEPSGGPPARDP